MCSLGPRRCGVFLDQPRLKGDSVPTVNTMDSWIRTHFKDQGLSDRPPPPTWNDKLTETGLSAPCINKVIYPAGKELLMHFKDHFMPDLYQSELVPPDYTVQLERRLLICESAVVRRRTYGWPKKTEHIFSSAYVTSWDLQARLASKVQ